MVVNYFFVRNTNHRPGTTDFHDRFNQKRYVDDELYRVEKRQAPPANLVHRRNPDPIIDTFRDDVEKNHRRDPSRKESRLRKLKKSRASHPVPIVHSYVRVVVPSFGLNFRNLHRPFDLFLPHTARVFP